MTTPRSCIGFHVSSLFTTIALLLGGILAGLSASEPLAFHPIDTSRLMGSPDPMPLEPERIFPNLSFNRPLEFTFAPDGNARGFLVGA